MSTCIHAALSRGICLNCGIDVFEQRLMAGSGEHSDQGGGKAMAELLRDLDLHWSFDNGQQHTHSWHDKQDFLERWRAKLPPSSTDEAAQN